MNDKKIFFLMQKCYIVLVKDSNVCEDVIIKSWLSYGVLV